MNRKIQYEIQDVSLWPTLLSLDQKKDKEQLRIKTLIQNTKKDFFKKNLKNLILENVTHLLDPSRDIYYRPKVNEPSLCKAGLHYSIPDDVVGIGLAISPEYENQNQWAVLYHGTKPKFMQSILKNGLKPGRGQAHQGTEDPWGSTVPNGVYFSFWLNQAFQYTDDRNPIILEVFVKNVFVTKGHKGYAVSNNHKLSRILIPLEKERIELHL